MRGSAVDANAFPGGERGDLRSLLADGRGEDVQWRTRGRRGGMKGRGRARGGELVAMLCGSVRGQHGQEHGAQPGRRIVAGEIIPVLARPSEEGQIVESAYRAGGAGVAEATLRPREAMLNLVLEFVSTQSRRAGSSSRQLRQDCNDGSRRSCTRSAGVRSVARRGRRGCGVG